MRTLFRGKKTTSNIVQPGAWFVFPDNQEKPYVMVQDPLQFIREEKSKEILCVCGKTGTIRSIPGNEEIIILTEVTLAE